MANKIAEKIKPILQNKKAKLGEFDSTPDLLEEFVGQKVVFIGARFIYWGVLSRVVGGRNGCVVLSDAVGVEETGPCNGERPNTVDPIMGSVVVFLDALEIMMQPRWSLADLPGEDAE